MQIEYIAPFNWIEGGHLSDYRHASPLMELFDPRVFKNPILWARLIKDSEIIDLDGL